MKFSINLESLLRMAETVGEWAPARKRGALLRLLACEERVCLEAGGKIAEAEARVRESGQCCLSQASFLHVLKQHQQETEITVTVNAHGLHLGGSSVPVTQFAPHATLPTACQMFLAMDLDA